MLLMALMPTLSRAFAPQRDAASVLMEICSAGGLKRTIAAPSTEGSGKQMLMMDDCPYCRVQHDLPALPPAPLAPLVATLATGHPPLFYHAPAPLHAWVAAHPRGPPAA